MTTPLPKRSKIGESVHDPRIDHTNNVLCRSRWQAEEHSLLIKQTWNPILLICHIILKKVRQKVEDLYFFIWRYGIPLFCEDFGKCFRNKQIEWKWPFISILRSCIAHHQSVKEKKISWLRIWIDFIPPPKFRRIMTFNNFDILSIHARCPM